jgi:hypothetical protein
LFTNVPITKGQIVTEYQGACVSREHISYIEQNWQSFGFASKDHVVPYARSKAFMAELIIGISDPDFAERCNLGGGSFINDPRNTSLVNCKYFNDQNRVFIKATKNIAVGEELLISYGRVYWTRSEEAH